MTTTKSRIRCDAKILTRLKGEENKELKKYNKHDCILYIFIRYITKYTVLF